MGTTRAGKRDTARLRLAFLMDMLTFALGSDVTGSRLSGVGSEARASAW